MKPEFQIKPHWEPYHDRLPISPWAFAQVSLTLVLFVAAAIAFVLLNRLTFFWWAGIAVGASGPIFLVLSHLEKRCRNKSRSHLESKLYQICPECLYDLRSATGQSACPECGNPFDPAMLPETWRLIDKRAQKPTRD